MRVLGGWSYVLGPIVVTKLNCTYVADAICHYCMRLLSDKPYVVAQPVKASQILYLPMIPGSMHNHEFYFHEHCLDQQGRDALVLAKSKEVEEGLLGNRQ